MQYKLLCKLFPMNQQPAVFSSSHHNTESSMLYQQSLLKPQAMFQLTLSTRLYFQFQMLTLSTGAAVTVQWLRRQIQLDSLTQTDAFQLVNCSRSQDQKQQSSCDQWLWLSVAHRVCRKRPTSSVDVQWDERPAGKVQPDTGVLGPADPYGSR